MKELCVKFHLADSAYMTAIRLVAGAVCSAEDVDVETSEDFKVCVTESAIILKNCGYESAEFRFIADGGVVCEVMGEGGQLKPSENEFSLALVSALVSDCQIENKGGIVRKVTLKI